MSRPTNNSLVRSPTGPLTQVPQWVATMRQAAQQVLKEEDVKAIVANQVEKAKAGDQAAIKFVFDQLLGGPLKGATFVQNVYHDGKPPEEHPASEEPPPRVPPTHQRPRNPFR